LQHSVSPDVQVIMQPSFVISHLHIPIVRLQQQTIIPFIMQQQEHMPPCSIMQRLCIMLQAIGSSQEQVIFMPPVHFSIFMVQRGTIKKLGAVGMPLGEPIVEGAIPGMPIPGIAMPVRSIIIAFAIGPCSLERAPACPSFGRSPAFVDVKYTQHSSDCNDFADCATCNEYAVSSLDVTTTRQSL
jgi:hypothetical protein